MTNKYSVEQIEQQGKQAVGCFYGVKREGWIMNNEDFVDYAGFAQIITPLTEGNEVFESTWFASI